MIRYKTNLASVVTVLSMLYRPGIDATLTMGKTAVNIVIAGEDGICLAGNIFL